MAKEVDRDLRQALRQDAERRKLEAIAVRDSVRIGRNLSIAVLRALREGGAFALPIEETLQDFTKLLIDLSTASHMLGATRSIVNAESHMRKLAKQQRALAVTVYDEALNFMQNRLDLTANDVASISRTYTDTAIEVTRNTTAIAELQAQKAATQIVAEGMHVREGASHMKRALEAGGVAGAEPHLLETLTRTQSQLAYGAGRWAANQDPAIDEILWGYRYITVRDGRVRPKHYLVDRTTLKKDDPFWQRHWPPNGFNCRCSTVEVYKSDHAEQQIQYPPTSGVFDGKQVFSGPDKGFAFNPGNVYQTTTDMVGEKTKTLINQQITHSVARTVATPDEID